MIRRAEAADLDAVLAIEEASHPHPWTRAAFAAELTNPLFLVTGAPVAAYIVVWHVAGELQIQNVTTAPSQRRGGHARALLQHVLATPHDRATLEVRENNAAARALYASLGFFEVGVRRGFYSNGAHAVLLDRVSSGDRAS